MKISTTTSYLAKEYGQHKALEMIAQAGFDCLDMYFGHMATDDGNEFLQPGAKALCKDLRKRAEDLGIYYNQAHSPYRMDHKPWLEGRREDILRRYRICFELAGILGVRNVVVHPLHCMNYLNNDPRWIMEQNVEYYSSLIPMAQDAGVKIAIENMWQKNKYNKHITLSACSSPYELRDYVDACNAVAPVFTACLDVGHCVLTGHDPVNAIEVLGGRLDALHIHDVDGVGDNHTRPLTQIVDFYGIVDALGRIGYTGEFTLEADSYYKKFLPQHHGKALQELADVCKLLVK